MGGLYFNFPENNCCKCGLENIPVNVIPSTLFGCTHTILNNLSKPIVEYCKVPGLTKT